jgi:hypothetical protein
MEPSNKTTQEQIDELLAKTADDVKELLKDREKLLRRKPFTRGGVIQQKPNKQKPVHLGSKVAALQSRIKKEVITQDEYMSELDPYMHSVLYDENIPSICVKTAGNGVQEIKFVKAAQPFQQCIMEKQTLHMACLPMKFTLADKKPTETVQADFVTFKHYWDLRNQDGMKVKMVATAKSFGDAGLLYYIDRHGEVKSRLISYEDGYVICSHNDKNGDRMLEVVYYTSSDGDEVIDAWDDNNLYRLVYLDDNGSYSLQVEQHPFGEIPLITKRTKVAWDGGQTLIESYERLDNIFKVLQNKFGWGLLWVKGRIDPKAKKIAGNIVLNDTSYEGKGEAKFLEPPSPQNTIDTLDQIFAQIQIATGTTFILPKDIHTSSDTSGIAVQMTQSLDIQTAKNGIVEWQNVADKMVRLFKRGLAVELVNKGIKKDAITEFDKMNINAQFDIWQPFSEMEYNQGLATMKQAGILSQRTAIEANTISRPDEVERVKQEQEELAQKELDKLKQTKEIESKYSASSKNTNNNSE